MGTMFYSRPLRLMHFCVTEILDLLLATFHFPLHQPLATTTLLLFLYVQLFYSPRVSGIIQYFYLSLI